MDLHCCRHPSYDDLQASCKKLSAATQLVDNLKKDLVEEQQRRTAADRALERTSGRLTDLKRALASGRGSDAVASLKQEAAKLRDLVNGGLPKYASQLLLPPLNGLVTMERLQTLCQYVANVDVPKYFLMSLHRQCQAHTGFGVK